MLSSIKTNAFKRIFEPLYDSLFLFLGNAIWRIFFCEFDPVMLLSFSPHMWVYSLCLSRQCYVCCGGTLAHRFLSVYVNAFYLPSRSRLSSSSSTFSSNILATETFCKLCTIATLSIYHVNFRVAI